MKRIVAFLLALAMICGCAISESVYTGDISMKAAQAKQRDVWMKNPDAKKGFIGGTLEEILRPLIGRKGKFTVYVRSNELLRADGVSQEDISNVKFAVDTSVFKKKKHVVRVSDSDPVSGTVSDGAIYVWVEKKASNKPNRSKTQRYMYDMAALEEEAGNGSEEPIAEPTPTVVPTPTITPTPTVEPTPTPVPGGIEIYVDAENCFANRWSNLPVTFTLSGIPYESGEYRYAVINPSGAVELPEGKYEVNENGRYSLAFAILNGKGETVSQSDGYELMLDFTPPVILSVTLDGADDDKFAVKAEDNLSGIADFSVNAGKKWHVPTTANQYDHTSAGRRVFEKGEIMARDKAGNTAAYQRKFKLPSGYSPSGSGGNKKPVHAPPSGYSLTPYNALSLSITDEPMSGLIVGDRELDLRLEKPTGESIEFTAELLDIDGEAALTLEANGYDQKDCVWAFNGEVLKLLANSDVGYLAFKDGQSVTALPTSGFVAGVDYIRLRGEGVPTRKFNYRLWSKHDRPTEREVVIEVAVDAEDGGTYLLGMEKGSDMYCQNVIIGDDTLFIDR